MSIQEKGIEITRDSPNKGVTIQQDGVLISSTGKSVSGSTIGEGYVYLVVDCSASMKGYKLNQAKNGALNFAKDALVKGYSTGLIRFDSSAKLLCEPKRQLTVLNECLSHLKTGDTTYMAEAIRLAHDKLKGKLGTRVMVIITDGEPNGPGDPEATLKAGNNAKKDGIDIIAIGTDDADQYFLKKLASRTDLGVMVRREQLEQTITASARMLPGADQLKLGR